MSPNLKRPIIALVHGGRSLHVRCARPTSPAVRSYRPFVRPKKSSSTQDRAFEYVQKAA